MPVRKRITRKGRRKAAKKPVKPSKGGSRKTVKKGKKKPQVKRRKRVEESSSDSNSSSDSSSESSSSEDERPRRRYVHSRAIIPTDYISPRCNGASQAFCDADPQCVSTNWGCRDKPGVFQGTRYEGPINRPF